MIKIAKKIKDVLQGLPIADKVGGLVYTYEKKTEDGVKRFPVGCGDNCNTNELVDYIPDFNKKSVMYIEHNSTQRIPTQDTLKRLVTTWQSDMSIIIWYNNAKFGIPSCNDISMSIVNTLESYLIGLDEADECKNINIEIRNVIFNEKTIFNRYTYNSEVYQYISFPYQAVKINVVASYQIPKNCFIPIEISPEIC